jgi:NAD-dependent deacetylase
VYQLLQVRCSEHVFVVGTSNLIYPAAELPHYAMKRKKYVVEINPVETSLSNWVSLRINTLAAAAMLELVSR